MVHCSGWVQVQRPTRDDTRFSRTSHPGEQAGRHHRGGREGGWALAAATRARTHLSLHLVSVMPTSTTPSLIRTKHTTTRDAKCLCLTHPFRSKQFAATRGIDFKIAGVRSLQKTIAIPKGLRQERWSKTHEEHKKQQSRPVYVKASPTIDDMMVLSSRL